MEENPYRSPVPQGSSPPNVNRRPAWLAWLAYGTLALGTMILAQGAVAFYFRINVLTGAQYGPSLTPIYLIFSGIAVCVVGLALKTVADWKKPKKQ